MIDIHQPLNDRQRRFWIVLLLGLFVTACGTRPAVRPERVRQEVGWASYYARGFDGRRTASGERYDENALTAAHPSLPFGTMLRVTNLNNHRTVTVRVNDRGPFVKGRIIDISYAAAKRLRMLRDGLARVILTVLP
jgi:peptidoglycan lytic transglycosylase